jgi:hypothetical protein
VLHVLWPDRYTVDVDMAGSQSVRDRSVLALKNSNCSALFRKNPLGGAAARWPFS